MQYTQLQIDVLDFYTTFWHRKSIPITFEQECR